jgi:hypothetical protein
MQVHPETTNSYARDPSNKLSETYVKSVEKWKRELSHPEHYPLILTRPFDVRDYLPGYISVPMKESVEAVFKKIVLNSQKLDAKVIVDFTDVLQDVPNDRQKWIETWDTYRVQVVRICKKHNIDQSQILCIQRVDGKEVGGIRLLPLADLAVDKIEKQHQFLLEWISKFGFSANRVELDRWIFPSDDRVKTLAQTGFSISKLESKEEFIACLNAFEDHWRSNRVEKVLMVKGALQVLKGLLTNLSEKNWNQVTNSLTQSLIVQLSFLRIKEQLQFLSQEGDETSFYDTASHIEQIQANLTSLLEVFSPFTQDDFSKIYPTLLTSIPENLKPRVLCGIHSNGMMSLASIIKAVEKTLGRMPRIFYGENTYFENIRVVEWVSNASSMDVVTEKDWKDFDLLLVQFNPPLKRIDFKVDEYGVEKIAETLRKTLDARQGNPITLALDCTIDFIDPPRIGELLAEFQKEIELGALNVICYRSGVKFDLFGMDNYCGAPFYMIHNQDAKWAAFNSLLTDPVLQTDRLSLNWFCLVYQNAAPQLELYRKQIFDNTRTLLERVPPRLLYDKNAYYRIIPVLPEVDPAFIDIKVFGPSHGIKASLVGGLLTIKCMEEKHPMFYRPSLGFYHPNLSRLDSKESTTFRLTLGLDPAQIDLLVECFEMIDALNNPF